MTDSVYTLIVSLYQGPLSREFAEANPVVARTIQVRGSQTLERLHLAIFEAFDRWDEHLYEFHFGCGPRDYSRGRYGPPHPAGLFAALDPEEPAKDATTAKVGSLGLEVGDRFGYLFDFGDDWYHGIEVTAIEKPEANVKYPRVTDRIGDSPPQYLDEDDEWEGEDG